MELKEKSEECTNTGSNVFLFKSDTSQQHIESVVWTAFKSGDRSAFDFIFQRYIKLLYTYGGKISKDRTLVEDCIQELFIEMWQKRELLADVSSVKFYLLKSLRRRIIRKIASEKGLLTKGMDSLDTETEAELPIEFDLIQQQATFEQQQKLSTAMAQLSKRQREAIYLKFYEKVSYEELAEIMNLGTKSAYNIVGKAIDSLRRSLKFRVP